MIQDPISLDVLILALSCEVLLSLKSVPNHF
jgi:hypothetical protein